MKDPHKYQLTSLEALAVIKSIYFASTISKFYYIKNDPNLQ